MIIVNLENFDKREKAASKKLQERNKMIEQKVINRAFPKKITLQIGKLIPCVLLLAASSNSLFLISYFYRSF